MKSFLILVSLVALVAAEPPVYSPPSSSYQVPPSQTSFSNSYSAPQNTYSAPQQTYSAPQNSYSAPAPQPQNTYSAPQSTYGAPAPAPEYGAPVRQGKVYRHVYIHAAPEEPVERQNRVIRVPGNADKHVNIIFVKAPSSSSQSNTEVILPEQPQQKTLVYVLVRKAQNSNDVKIRGPGPTQPSKPEVYFIRYKNDEPSSEYGAPSYSAPPSSSYGAPASPPSSSYGAPSPSSSYGAPAPAPSSSYGAPSY